MNVKVVIAGCSLVVQNRVKVSIDINFKQKIAILQN